MDAVALRAALEEVARGEGFDLVGVAAAGPLPRDGAALSRWLAAGRHASMSWMERTAAPRSDPGEILPGCRSVVVLGWSYWPGEEAAAVRPGVAEVALYARGRDYHRVLGEALRRVGDWIERATGERARACVDSVPVLERAWAERAGIGWIGKNTMLLTRTHGSWLMLGEVLTTAGIEPDEGPQADACGTCTACLDACPTGALAEGRVLDARRCISYWTIEHRGEVPEEVRPGIGDWIFGCDVCQTVCPWNQRFAQPRTALPFGAREELRGLDPVAVLEMDEATFRARFSGTPLMRARWDGMRRNACIVLGNRRDPAAVPALSRALRDSDPVIRSHAAWALERIASAA